MTLLGTIKEVKAVQPLKVEDSIVVTPPSCIVTFIKPVQFSKAEYFIVRISSKRVREVKPVHPLKAISLIVVIVEGMKTDVKSVHPRKADLSIIVTV